MLQKYKPHTTKGFTLIEMLVVIVMVGVVAAIAAPSWQGFLDRQRMNAVRNDLMSLLRNAQDEAQARQQSKQVVFPTTTSITPLTVTVKNSDLNSISSTSFAGSSGVPTVLGDGKMGNKFHIVAPAPIVFDYNGRVSVATPYAIPYAIKIVDSQAPTPPTGQSPTQSCVIVTTLLGGLKPANNSLCDNFSSNP